MAKTNNNQPIIGVSYTRISTLGQITDEAGLRKEDASPEAHKARCTQHMAFKSNSSNLQYEISEHIVDEGYSGKNTNRPGFHRLTHLIRQQKIKFVVTPELARISRSVMDFLDFMSLCEKSNVSVLVIGQDIDTTTPVGKMVVTILMAVAQAEREITSHRLRENCIARLIKNGKINGSAEVLGLKRDPSRRGHFVIDPVGVPILRKVLGIFLEEPTILATIKRLEKEGITNPDGSKITHSQLSTILENCRLRYLGYWEANRHNKDVDESSLSEFQRYQLVKLEHGPVVEETLLEAVVTKHQLLRASNLKVGVRDYVYLLSGRLFYQDGSSFSGEGAKSSEHRYYNNRKHKGLRIRCDEIDPFVINLVKDQFLKHEKFEQMVKDSVRLRETKVPALQAELKGYENQLAETRRQEDILRQRLVESLSQPMSTAFEELLSKEAETLKYRKQSLEKEIEKARSTLSELKNDNGLESLQVYVKKVLQGFDTLTQTQKRTLIERIVKRILILDGNRMEVEFFTDGPAYRVPAVVSSVTVEDYFSVSDVNGGVDGTRTRGLSRDRRAL